MLKTLGRSLLITAAVCALAVACNRGEDAAEAPPPPAVEVPVPETPADSPAPLSYESKTEHAEVKLTLPEGLRSQPDLHARLYAEAVRNLRTFSEGAVADRTEYMGDRQMPPYEKAIEYAVAGQTGKLFSLQRNDYEFTGGAHPNPGYGAVLWDKALKRIVEPAQLFRRGVDLAPLDEALCDAINAARLERSPDAAPISLEGADWSCPRANVTPFVLAPSTTTGKAGGLIFLIGPYQVGPYAEGGYEIVVPQTAFRRLLAPAYTDEFAGNPVRTGDVSRRG